MTVSDAALPLVSRVEFTVLSAILQSPAFHQKLTEWHKTVIVASFPLPITTLSVSLRNLLFLQPVLP